MIVIMGPGRCGTTLIIRLLKEMGYDTGESHEIFRERREEIQDPNFKWPKVVKGTGALCHNLNRWVKTRDWNVEVVIMCYRELDANVKSMMKKKKGRGIYKKLTPEQLEGRIAEEVPSTYKRAEEQIRVGGYRKVDIHFPKSAQDMEYCYSKLVEAVPDLDKEKFRRAWSEVVDPTLIRFGG
jgi:hypothetical protein